MFKEKVAVSGRGERGLRDQHGRSTGSWVVCDAILDHGVEVVVPSARAIFVLEVPQKDSWGWQGKDGTGKEANAEVQSLGLRTEHLFGFGHVIDEHGTVSNGRDSKGTQVPGANGERIAVGNIGNTGAVVMPHQWNKEVGDGDSTGEDFDHLSHPVDPDDRSRIPVEGVRAPDGIAIVGEL